VDFEVEYNNRARVPEHPEIIDRWQQDAASYRSQTQCELDLAYGDSARSVLDLFHPGNGDGDTPLAVFIHGGYWQAMDGKTFSMMVRGLNGHGISVAVPTYDLCPDVTVEEIVRQIRQCCIWLWHRYEKPLTLFGHSAGGHLTAAMVATDWRDEDASLPADLCRKGYAISGVFDLAPLIGTSINKAAGLDAASATHMSPLHWQPARGAHLTAAVGGEESSEFLRQSRTVCETWGDLGVHSAYREIDGANHFTVLDDLTDPDSVMVREIAHLARSGALKGP